MQWPVGLIIMKDLNSLSKEELIKLLNQKEEELKAAEERAEKEHVIAKEAQKAAEIKEQSHLKFAHGVIFMAQNLREVNGNYLAQVEDFWAMPMTRSQEKQLESSTTWLPTA